MEKTDEIMTHSIMRIDKVETAVVEVTTRLGILEHQGIYLRSGTIYESPPMPEVEAKEVSEEDIEEEEIEVESTNMPSEVQLEFLKEIMSKKKKLVDYETVSLTENCNAIIQQKMPAKMKDPGSFDISCVMGNDRQTNALCDLGASINLMPLSFFLKLKFGVLKPTTITLQMADKSIKFPNGVLENVLVRVNDSIFPVDFVVLDMKEDPNVPLILGRPFLATGKALIDVTKRTHP
ncbi:uncharacterized protein LOC121810426 [Salvia splendens]|uniref:uncharacterized protein LOC121810426 n=1 Tax=Salvia splendens TaxID=180675 RepID=UPI001C256100|nr:uncharacterized protein LOC121810426 [Salvia splendens]